MDRRRNEIAKASTGPIVQGCLVGVAAAALLVGIVSATVLRHIVQIIPIALALGVEAAAVAFLGALLSI